MIKDSKEVAEVREIRAKLEEVTKDMSPEQFRMFVRADVDKILKEKNIKLRTVVPVV
jgi:hypothetical protein